MRSHLKVIGLALLLAPASLLSGEEARFTPLRLNDWFHFERDWHSPTHLPQKSICVYRIEVRPGESYSISLKYNTEAQTRFALSYSDAPPFDPLLSTNSKSLLLTTDKLNQDGEKIHNRIVKIDEQSQGRDLYITLAVEAGQEESFKFGIRATYLAFAGLTPNNQNTFVNDGNLILENHQALAENILLKNRGGTEIQQDLFERIPVLQKQNGYFFPTHLSQILIPREGILTRAGEIRALPEYSRNNTFDTRKVHFMDSDYSLTFRLHFSEETPLTAWILTYADNQFPWGSRELECYVNNSQVASLPEVEGREQGRWCWQRVGRFNFKNGQNLLKFRKKNSTGAASVIDKLLLTRDNEFKPEEYDEVHKISIGLPEEIAPKPLAKRNPDPTSLAGKWNYSVRNSEHRWNGHAVIRQSGNRWTLFGYARRHSDHKVLTWVENGVIRDRQANSRFANRYTEGNATYKLSPDARTLHGMWYKPGAEEGQGVIVMVRDETPTAGDGN